MKQEHSILVSCLFKFFFNHFQHFTGPNAKRGTEIKKRVYRWAFFAPLKLDKINPFQLRFLRHLPLAQISSFPEALKRGGNGCFETRVILHPYRIT